MKDIRLWQLLVQNQEQQDDRRVAELKALLGQLALVGPRARMPFLSGLNAIPKSKDPELRELQMRVFSGVSGWKAWQIMLNHTADPSPAVRRAATAAMIESAKANPWLLAHVLFHPDPEIRVQTVEHFVNAYQSVPAVLLYLLNDEHCCGLVTGAVASQGLATRAAPNLVIALHQVELLSAELTQRLVATMSESELLNCLGLLPNFFSEAECERILASTGPLPRGLAAPGGRRIRRASVDVRIILGVR